MKKTMCVLAALMALQAGPGMAQLVRIETEAKFREVVEGALLTRPLVKLTVTGDGRISGTGAFDDIQGRWQWDGDYFCREMTWGSREIAWDCQTVSAAGDTIRFTAERGAGDSAEFSLKR